MGRRYRMEVRGTLMDKVGITILFTLACVTVILIPVGIVLMIETVEFVEVDETS